MQARVGPGIADRAVTTQPVQRHRITIVTALNILYRVMSDIIAFRYGINHLQHYEVMPNRITFALIYSRHAGLIVLTYVNLFIGGHFCHCRTVQQLHSTCILRKIVQ